MDKQTNYTSLAVAGIGAVSEFLGAFGIYDATPDQVQAAIKVAGFILVLWGIWRNHHKTV